MKKLRLLISACLFAAAVVSSVAQRYYSPDFSIGIKGGATLSQMSFMPTVRQKMTEGMTFGVMARYTEEKLFGLIAELNVTQRGWKEDYEEHPFSYSRRLTYIQLPLLTHIYFGSRHMKCFVNLGPEVGLMLHDRIKANFNYADDQIENVLKFLEEKKLMDNTIVVISSDHGDEFNDNKLNYWSHGGNFTDPQVKVPLVIHWPGKEAGEVNYLTSHLDLVPTILPEVLGCTNPTKGYSVGQSIWEPENRRDWVYVSGYSLDGFVEPDRIVLINRAGMLEHLDKTFRPAPGKDIPNYMSDVLEELRRYSK